MKRILKLPRTLALAGGILTLGLSGAYAVEISDIAVRSEAAVIADNAAATFWPNLEADLKNALVQQLAENSSASGVVMQVTVRSLSVSDSADATTDDGVLETTVMFISGDAATGALTHSVTVNQQVEDGIHGDTLLLPRTSEDFYHALIRHYAETVAEKVRTFTNS